MKPGSLRAADYIIILNMKTIVVTVDEPTLARIDRIARARPTGGTARARRPNRSGVVRQALKEFVIRYERHSHEEKDRAAFAAHRKRIRRESEALVAEQADV